MLQTTAAGRSTMTALKLESAGRSCSWRSARQFQKALWIRKVAWCCHLECKTFQSGSHLTLRQTMLMRVCSSTFAVLFILQSCSGNYANLTVTGVCRVTHSKGDQMDTATQCWLSWVELVVSAVLVWCQATLLHIWDHHQWCIFHRDVCMQAYLSAFAWLHDDL